MSYPRNTPSFKVFAWIAGIVTAFGIALVILLYLAFKDIAGKIQDKIDSQTAPEIVQKYDSATQVKIEKIEVHRQMSHEHIDNLYDNQLQDALDSVYNAE